MTLSALYTMGRDGKVSCEQTCTDPAVVDANDRETFVEQSVRRFAAERTAMPAGISLAAFVSAELSQTGRPPLSDTERKAVCKAAETDPAAASHRPFSDRDYERVVYSVRIPVEMMQ